MSKQLSSPAPRALRALSKTDAAVLRAEQRMLATLEAREDARLARAQRRNVATVAMLRLRAILKDAEIESAEGFCALVRVAWGVFLLMPWSTFAASPTTFQGMERAAPEWLWGLAILAGGILSMVALLTGTHRWRLCAMFVGATTWGYLSGLFLWSNPESTTSVIYPAFALLSCWAFLRLSVWRGGRWAS